MSETPRLLTTWEGLVKNADGAAEIHTLHKYDHTPAVDIASLLVNPAAPTIIRPRRRVFPQRRGESLSLVAGDAQIPFQDERAVALFQLAVAELRPDTVIFTGDMLDLPNMSRFEQRPEWAATTQSALDRYHALLAQTRATVPGARIAVIHGNHEQRFDNYVRRNAAEVLGLRRANAASELGVLTLQSLARYDELAIESVDGYPNGTLWLADNLKCVHGTHAQKGGSNAARYLRTERESTIYGHSHRMEVAYRTIPQRYGHLTVAAASPGCLADVAGTVPGVHHTVDAAGRVVNRAEDWQTGLLIVRHDGLDHDITPVRFSERGMLLDGRRYTL